MNSSMRETIIVMLSAQKEVLLRISDTDRVIVAVGNGIDWSHQAYSARNSETVEENIEVRL